MLQRLSLALVAGLSVCACSQPFDAEPPTFAATATAPAIILAAGDIARCGIGGDEQTARTLDSLIGVYPGATVVPLGDLVYPDERRADGKAYLTLDWTGANGSSVDVYRDGPKLLSTPNDGHYVNSKAWTGPTSYVYKVCDPAGCSGEVSVTVQ